MSTNLFVRFRFFRWCVYPKEQIVLEIYTTLVLWYFAKKVLRHRTWKRKFLLRSQGLFAVFAATGVAGLPSFLLPADLAA